MFINSGSTNFIKYGQKLENAINHSCKGDKSVSKCLRSAHYSLQTIY